MQRLASGIGVGPMALQIRASLDCEPSNPSRHSKASLTTFKNTPKSKSCPDDYLSGFESGGPKIVKVLLPMPEILSGNCPKLC